jgi:hypothetical protein
VDGRHAVSLQSDDPAAVTEGLIWARETYKKLMGLGPSPQLDDKSARQSVEAAAEPANTEADGPICGVHEVAMILMHGRRGDFWSCHKKNPDNSWCSYKPPS